MFKYINQVSHNFLFNAIYKINFLLVENFCFVLCILAVSATLIERGIKKKKKKPDQRSDWKQIVHYERRLRGAALNCCLWFTSVLLSCFTSSFMCSSIGVNVARLLTFTTLLLSSLRNECISSACIQGHVWGFSETICVNT